MEEENIRVFTFKIFTETPGSYLIHCLNVPDFVLHCKELSKVHEITQSHLDFLLTVEKQSLFNEYTPTQFIDDGWHFQLTYDSENCKCIGLNRGKSLLSNHSQVKSSVPKSLMLLSSHLEVLKTLLTKF